MAESERELVERLYVTEDRSIEDCASICGVTPGVFHARLVKYAIPRRPVGRRPRVLRGARQDDAATQG